MNSPSSFAVDGLVSELCRVPCAVCHDGRPSLSDAGPPSGCLGSGLVLSECSLFGIDRTPNRWDT